MSLICRCRRDSQKINTGGFFILSYSPELTHIEFVVEATCCKQLLVPATLDDLTSFEDQDLIGVADSAEAVSDNKTGTSGQQLVQRLLNLPFRTGIDTARCF